MGTAVSGYIGWHGVGTPPITNRLVVQGVAEGPKVWPISLLARVKIILAWLDDLTRKLRTLMRGVEVCELDGMAERLLLGLPELMRWGLC